VARQMLGSQTGAVSIVTNVCEMNRACPVSSERLSTLRRTWPPPSPMTPSTSIRVSVADLTDLPMLNSQFFAKPRPASPRAQIPLASASTGNFQVTGPVWISSRPGFPSCLP